MREEILLEEGDLIKIVKGHIVYTEIPKHFLDYLGDFTLTRATVEICETTAYLVGEYVVVKTTLHGGGSTYDPDGHHVFCESVSTRRELDFYQSGCFDAINTNIKPIGKAVLKWVVQ